MEECVFECNIVPGTAMCNIVHPTAPCNIPTRYISPPDTVHSISFHLGLRYILVHDATVTCRTRRLISIYRLIYTSTRAQFLVQIPQPTMPNNSWAGPQSAIASPPTDFTPPSRAQFLVQIPYSAILFPPRPSCFLTKLCWLDRHVVWTDWYPRTLR